MFPGMLQLTAQTGIREVLEAGLILTDPTVWPRKARGTLAAVPVIPIDTSSTVVAVGREGGREGKK